MTQRQVYLEPMPVDEAKRLWREKLEELGVWGPLGQEEVPVDDSLGRVTAGPVFAGLSSPFYHSAAMDGVAVRFEDTLGASERSPKRLELGRKAIYVDTGDPLPEGFDSVIMVEEIDELEGGVVEIIAPATPWQHVRVIGEDMVATELILPENQAVRPQDLSAMLAGGVTKVGVRRRPVVALIPTGDELVEPGATLKKGDIIEYNSRMLAGMARLWGAEPLRYGIVPDSLETLKGYVLDAAGKADIVVVNAGSSAGSEDFTYHAAKELGEVFVHGINTKPGKPTILGAVNGKPFIGAPGYPVSAWLVFELFAKEAVYRMQGLTPPLPEKVGARLSRQLASQLGPEEFIRVKLGRVGENVVATPLQRGAGVLMSLVKADGIIRIPPSSEGLAAGAAVEAELLVTREALENTVVVIGSHDNALDLLASFLKRKHPRLSLSSAHVGSMGGLVALSRGEAHMAGCHLLDEDTGEYNVSYIQRQLAGTKTVLVNLVYRVQGLIVPKGNPKGIAGFADLARPDVSFVNRQAGAGTRLLADLHLRRAGIDARGVKGYEHEEYTHMGVASAVLTGVADTGLGILAAANALGLDFIPVAEERYDLVIPEVHYETENVRAVMGLIREDMDFRKAVDAMGGYDTRDMGKELWRG